MSVSSVEDPMEIRTESILRDLESSFNTKFVAHVNKYIPSIGNITIDRFKSFVKSLSKESEYIRSYVPTIVSKDGVPDEEFLETFKHKISNIEELMKLMTLTCPIISELLIKGNPVSKEDMEFLTKSSGKILALIANRHNLPLSMEDPPRKDDVEDTTKKVSKTVSSFSTDASRKDGVAGTNEKCSKTVTSASASSSRKENPAKKISDLLRQANRLLLEYSGSDEEEIDLSSTIKPLTELYTTMTMLDGSQETKKKYDAFSNVVSGLSDM